MAASQGVLGAVRGATIHVMIGWKSALPGPMPGETRLIRIQRNGEGFEGGSTVMLNSQSSTAHVWGSTMTSLSMSYPHGGTVYLCECYRGGNNRGSDYCHVVRFRPPARSNVALTGVTRTSHREAREINHGIVCHTMSSCSGIYPAMIHVRYGIDRFLSS